MARPDGERPQRIDLPLASGKTAGVNIEVYTLEVKSDSLVSERTDPRRIWFVVDEAYDRACQIVRKLCKGRDGVLLKIVAVRLRQLSGLAEGVRPLAMAYLHGLPSRRF